MNRDRLVQRLLPAIRRRVGTEDLVQDVLEVLFRNDGRVLAAWSPERGLSLESYVSMVAARVAASARRSGRRSGWREEPVDPELLAELAGACHDRHEARELLSRLLAVLTQQLSPRALKLFVQLFVDGDPVGDVSDATGLSSCAVHAWRSRLRKTAVRAAGQLA